VLKEIHGSISWKTGKEQMKMLRMKRLLYSGVILFIFLMVIQACSTERRSVHRFLRSRDSINVCIISPVSILKDNLKTWEIAGYDSLPEKVQDSMLYYHSRYLQFINDSLLLGLYTSDLRALLENSGLKVFAEESMDKFLAAGGKAYSFTIAQVMLEEYLEPYTKTLSFDTNDYRWELWQNAVDMDVWYEARVLNRNESKMKVLYASMYVRDKITGHLEGNIFTGDVNFVYHLDTISMGSLYTLASKAAKMHAQFIFDYILNDDLVQKTKPGDPQPAYLHYDAEKKKFRKAGNYKFTDMK
jgi:hypothetical protein